MYAKGLQDAGVLAVAKHFPGHGDTKTDSHLGLPVISHSAEHLDSVELKPFKHVINQGIGGIMSGHLHVAYFNPEQKIPASLSTKIIRNKLVDDLGLSGLIITDAMNMQGITKLYSPGEAAVKALQAGNDMLEMTPNLQESISDVIEAVKAGKISQSAIDWKCRKVLAVKKWLELDDLHSIKPVNLNQPKNELTRRLLHEKSLTLLKNKNNLIPLQKLDTLKVATVSIGRSTKGSFQSMVDNYVTADHFQLQKEAGEDEIQRLSNYLNDYNLVICGIHDLKLSPKDNFGVEPAIDQFLSQLEGKKKIVVLLGNPYALKFIPETKNSDVLLITYQENRITQDLAAQTLFGAIDIDGKLPVSVNDEFKAGTGIPIKKNGRLKYTIPEESGIKSGLLEHKLDSLARLGIEKRAYPGCQILVAKDGKVIFHKCYGFHTYKNKKPVIKENIYDWASVTKITGPLPALIKLHGEKKFKLDVPFSFFYWPDFLNSNKKKLTAREILAHQARLQAWIPYWQNTLKKSGKPKKKVFKNEPTSKFDLRISSKLYMKRKYLQNIFDEIRESELLPKKEYKYSGLAYYLFPTIIENLTGKDYEMYLEETFYKPLGANTVTFNPYKHFSKELIIPTENDQYFRKELLHGFVHDEGAAMMGGVSGNAGLFGTVNDLAKLMQMYLQSGYYGGKRFLSAESFHEFTRIQYPENENRRGLGFDKPYINNHENELEDAYPAISASPKSFGHSGYTGTFTWADPEHNLLFIFFSNRVHPSRNNTKLFDLNLRTAMHQAIYDSMQLLK